MAKTNIKFNNKNYFIENSLLADATARLEAHLMAMMGTDEERLEGDGAEYYTLAPTALTFRSTEPLDEFSELKINGETIDPSNYTLEEGSTIVTLPIDYLKTLDVGQYDISVVSAKKAVDGNFTVAAPKLNEYGFYYNQPYTAIVPSIVPVLGGWTVAFFVREDGTFDSIAVGANTETGTYEINGNEIIAVSPLMGQINCTISADGTAIYCSQLDTNFVLGDTSIAADDDYIYTYKEDLGGYEVHCIDKTKAEYGAIKTGINGIDTVKLADNMFANCDNLTSVIIPNSVVTIGNDALMGCDNLTSVIIPDSVVTIGDFALHSCDNLISVTIGNSVTNIGVSALLNCPHLNNIVFTGTVVQWSAITKGNNWNELVPATHVHCTDGDVAL